MTEKYRSFTVTKGVARAPNRSMLRAIGYKDEDFDKPIIGIANGQSTMNPCNAGIQPLADAADAAARRAGAMPQMFGTITVTDGISMGTEGMKYSLVSREVIADSIETAVQSQFMDGVLTIGGCDKNMPGAMIGMARMNIPSIFVYGGTIKPGVYKGKSLTIVSSFEAVGAYTAGTMGKEEFECIERCALPGVGACGGMYTANTMSSSIEAIGLSLPYSSTMAAEDAEKRESAARSMEVLVQAVHKDIKPRDIITRKSLENAIAVVMAVGGSTNAVLHWLAIAHAAAVLIKRVVRRPRPHHPAVVVNVATPSRLSFPSAHATSTTAASMLLARTTGLPLPVFLVPPMALSRLVLGVHYPTDVLMGVAVGAAVAKAVGTIADRVEGD